MATQIEPNDTHKAIAAARAAIRLTTREFATALDVSQNAVYQWENGIAEPTGDRIAAWIRDSRDWVRHLGLRVFSIKYGPMLANIAEGDTPPSAA
jgi:hypothetical protein